MSESIIEVFHSAFGDRFKHVANVTCEGLDQAFHDTNSIQHHWSENDNVEAIGKLARSTSVDDFLNVDGVWYIVASFGFDEVSLDDEFEITLYNDDRDERYYETHTLRNLIETSEYTPTVA